MMGRFKALPASKTLLMVPRVRLRRAQEPKQLVLVQLKAGMA